MGADLSSRERRTLRRVHLADQRAAHRGPDKRRDKRDLAIFFGGFTALTLLALLAPGFQASTAATWVILGVLFAAAIAGIRLSYRVIRDEIQDIRDTFAR